MIINNYKIKVERKNVKNINLKVYPDLTIKASLPLTTSIKTFKRMINSKEEWLNNQLKKYEEQNRITKRSYESGEDHYFNGKRYILRVIDSNTTKVEIKNIKYINMYVRKSSSLKNKEKLMQSFYKEQLERKLKKYIPQLEKIIGVKSNSFSIRKMKNNWGSCNIEKKELIFNVELCKKKDSEIKYVIIYELLNLIEDNRSDNFKLLIEKYCPKWKIYNNSLNELLNPNKK